MSQSGSSSPTRAGSSSLRSGGAASLRGGAGASVSVSSGAQLSLNGNSTRMSPRPVPDAKDRVLPPASSLPKEAAPQQGDTPPAGAAGQGAASPSAKHGASASIQSTNSGKSRSSPKHSRRAGGKSTPSSSASKGGLTPSKGEVAANRKPASPDASAQPDAARATSNASSAISEHVPTVVPTPVPGTVDEEVSGRDSRGSASPRAGASKSSKSSKSPHSASGSSLQKAAAASADLKKATAAAKAGMSARSDSSDDTDKAASHKAHGSKPTSPKSRTKNTKAEDAAAVHLQRAGRGFLARQKVATMQFEQDTRAASKVSSAKGVNGGRTSARSASSGSSSEGKVQDDSTTLDVKTQAKSMGSAKGGTKPVKGGSPARSATPDSEASHSEGKHTPAESVQDEGGYDDEDEGGFDSESSEDEDEVGPDYSQLAEASRPYRVPMALTEYRIAHKHSLKLVDQPAQTQEGGGDVPGEGGQDGKTPTRASGRSQDVVLSVRPYVTAAQEEAAAAIKARLQQRRAAAAAAAAHRGGGDDDGSDDDGDDQFSEGGGWDDGKVQVPSVAVGGAKQGGVQGDPHDLEGKDEDDVSHSEDDYLADSSSAHARAKGLRLSSVLQKYKRGLDAVFAHYSGAGVGNAGERAVARRTFDNMANHGSAMRLPAWLRFCREFGLTPGLVSKHDATQLWQDTSVLSRSGGIMSQQFGHAVAALAVRLLTLPREVLDAAGAEPVLKGAAVDDGEAPGAAARHEVPFFDPRALVVGDEADPSPQQADMLDAITQARRSLGKLHTNGDRAAWFLRFFELHRVKDVHRRNRSKLLAGSSGDRSSYISAGFDRKPLGSTARTDGVQQGPGGDWDFAERGLQLQRIVTIGDSATELAAARRAASGAQTPQIVHGADLARAVNDEIMGSTGDELLLDLHHKRREQARMTNLDRREHKRRHQKPLEGVRVRQAGKPTGSPEGVPAGTQRTKRRSLPKVRESQRTPSKHEEEAPVHAGIPQDPTPDVSSSSQQHYAAPMPSAHSGGGGYGYGGGYAYGQSPGQYAGGQYDASGGQYGVAQGGAGGYYGQPPGSSPQQGGIHTPSMAPQQAGYGGSPYGQQGGMYGGGYAQPAQYGGGYAQPQALSPQSPAQRVAASAHARAAAVAQAQAAQQQASYAQGPSGQYYQQ